MKKKSVIILGSVVVVCGLFSSLFVDWPVDFSSASGRLGLQGDCCGIPGGDADPRPPVRYAG